MEKSKKWYAVSAFFALVGATALVVCINMAIQHEAKRNKAVVEILTKFAETVKAEALSEGKAGKESGRMKVEEAWDLGNGTHRCRILKDQETEEEYLVITGKGSVAIQKLK